MTEIGRGRFFAIDQTTWARVCDLGLNAAVAYLVLARGTGPDHRVSSWSADAIERKTGISWRRAKKAIKALESMKLLERIRTGTRPLYRLALPDEPAWIWLPNTLIDGVTGTSPLEQVRRVGDAMTLRLLIDLYTEQGLRDDGGIARRIIYQQFDRVRVGEYGEYVVFGFRPESWYVSWGSSITDPHRPKGRAGSNRGDDFFRRLKHLVALGLIEWVPTLWEHQGVDAEPIHPVYAGSSIDIEAELGRAADLAGRELLAEWQLRNAECDDGCEIFVPVKRHMENAALIGVARLTFRPQTSATSAWWATLHSDGPDHVEQYLALAARAAGSRSAKIG